jgi:5-methylcytosine-specific restriction endonuclease McrA
MTDPYKARQYQVNRRLVLEAAGFRCEVRGPTCTTTATTADHIVPVSAGGSSELQNLRAACRSCQNRQGGQIRQAIGRSRLIGRRSRRW